VKGKALLAGEADLQPSLQAESGQSQFSKILGFFLGMLLYMRTGVVIEIGVCGGIRHFGPYSAQQKQNEDFMSHV